MDNCNTDNLFHKECTAGGGSLFLWDPARQIGFSYVPTYLAWYDKEKRRGTKLLREAVFNCADKIVGGS